MIHPSTDSTATESSVPPLRICLPKNGNNCQCQSPNPPDLSRGSHPLPSPMDAGVPNHWFATEYCRDCCKALASSKLEEYDVLSICHQLRPARVSRAVHP
ncbi:hypothetical protein T03_4500 [Trichinella britovi]|uniref:Uncharacterized protein n=1 Tax=Trichinella britovi TaxID=45882 RepID=A0A0V1DB64_TRIBR|nr:hypothetical protein T03_4500 [Trichinella britovi]